MEKLLWTPHSLKRCDFVVDLDRTFASEMIRSKIPSEIQRRMNELANEELKQLEIDWLNPYMFHEDTCFITQFSLGHNGVWLATNYQNIADLVKGIETRDPVEYTSHNVDTPSHAYALLTLFDKWVRYADVLKTA